MCLEWAIPAHVGGLAECCVPWLDFKEAEVDDAGTAEHVLTLMPSEVVK